MAGWREPTCLFRKGAKSNERKSTGKGAELKEENDHQKGKKKRRLKIGRKRRKGSRKKTKLHIHGVHTGRAT